MMTPVLLTLAVFFHINGISCDGELTIIPERKDDCDYDAFISSKPINDKVFLAPYKSSERNGDWYENSGYCAAHCAEMVIINSAVENQHLIDFMRSIGMANNGVWLGAQIFNKKNFAHWYNGTPTTYTHTIDPTEYNEDGLTGLITGWNIQNFWGNWWLTKPGRSPFIACQRAADWKIFKCE